MRIALESDILTNGSRPTGFGIYLVNLIENLGKYAPPDYEFLLLHSRKKWNGGDFGKRFTPVSYHFTRSQFAAIAFRLSSVLKHEKADLFHATCTTGVPPFKLDIPTVTTMHDMYYNTPVMKRLYKWTLKNTDAFICNSHLTARLNNIPAAEVVYPGIQFEDFTAESDANTESIPLEKPYFLCVGAIEKRKGQLELAHDYAEALKLAPALPSMLFTGPIRENTDEFHSVMAQCKKIFHIEYVEKNTLAALYRNAKLFIMPSHSEGFGIPLIEAMHFGVPCLCRDTEIFHETAQNNAVFTRDFKTSLLNHTSVTAAFNREQAMLRAAGFSWKNNIEKTLSVYKKASGLIKTGRQ